MEDVTQPFVHESILIKLCFYSISPLEKVLYYTHRRNREASWFF